MSDLAEQGTAVMGIIDQPEGHPVVDGDADRAVARTDIDTIRATVNDELWTFVSPYLSDHGSRARTILSAVIYCITNGLAWRDLPYELGVTPFVAQRHLDGWTKAGLWQQLADAAHGTPHAQWAHTVVDNLPAKPPDQRNRRDQPSLVGTAAFARAVGRVLRQERRRRKWSLAETGEPIGLSVSVLCRLELGARPLDMQRLAALCAVLGRSPLDVIASAQAEAFPQGWSPSQSGLSDGQLSTRAEQ